MRLFDPADPEADWPEIEPAERAYIAGVGTAGATAFAENVRTRWLAFAIGDRVLPVTVNDGERGDSYVCSPYAAYVLYGLREMALMRVRGRTILAPLLRTAGALLRAAGIDRIVHVDNWLFSTNLHGDWEGTDLPAIRDALAARFPDHLVAIRSIDNWSCPRLAAAARADGWVMVPSRQVWVTDDLARDWRPRNAFGNDRRLVANSGLAIGAARADEAAPIAELYLQLYVGKYSALNPVFTPAFVSATLAAGLIDYRVARAADGRVMAVAGLLVRGDVATPPVVGYDMTVPQSAGLYRIASWMFAEMAMARGFRMHGSAGAAGFKRLRGAHGVIEYWAMQVDHLSSPRRFAIRSLAALLEGYAVPMMRRNGW